MTKRVYFRRVLAVFLAAAMLLGFGAIGAAAERSGGLTYIVVNGEVTITNYNGSDTDVVIPNAFDGYPVTAIGNVAFSGCTSLTSVTIPDSVTSIGSYAFESCTSLTSITIPDSITSISSFAFCDCTSLTFVTIPDSVTSIGSAAFASCTSLTFVTIPNNVTSIGSAAFASCTSLTFVTIPNSVTSIGSSAFEDCTNLTSITIPDSVTSIGSSAFYGCTSLTSITIPDSVTNIGSYNANVFSKGSNLTIYCYSNSVAHTYAIVHSIPFVLLDDESASVRKAALNVKIVTVENTAKGNYTDASWNTFQIALTVAKNVATNENATQEQVNNALNALNVAYDGLAPYTLTVTNGTGSGSYKAGAVVNIVANTPPAGKVFDKWTATAGTFADPGSADTTFTMPQDNATITATYKVPDAPAWHNHSYEFHYEIDPTVNAYARILHLEVPEGLVVKEWKSSNEKTATVDQNGVATMHKRGSAAITATLADGTTWVCNVEVTFDFGQWLLYIFFFGWIWMT